MSTDADGPTRSQFDSANPYSSPRAALNEPAIEYAGPLLNPWLSIWAQPRRTIRQIVNTDVTRHVLLIAALSGIFRSLDRAAQRNLGDTLPLGGILALAAIFGPIGGIMMLYLGAWVLRWVGVTFFGGVATAPQVRAAVAWGGVPGLTTNLLLWLPMLVLRGNEMFTSYTTQADDSATTLATTIALGIITLVGAVWTVVAMTKCVGEVQGFSAWRAMGSMLMVAGFFLVVILGLVVLALATRA